jgi:hypothetical protein
MVFCYIDLNLCWRSDTISRWGWGSQGATQALAPVQRGLAGGGGTVARGAVAARQVLCPATFARPLFLRRGLLFCVSTP